MVRSPSTRLVRAGLATGYRAFVSAIASASEPARLLAVFVAEDGAELTTFDQ